MKRIVIREGYALWVKNRDEFVSAMETWLGVKLTGSRRRMFEEMWDRDQWALCPDLVVE